MDPHEHFTKEQIEVLKDIHHAETNKMLVKVIGANLITVLTLAGAVAIGWYRLGNVEHQIAGVSSFISSDGRYTQDEGDAERNARVAADVELQRQIDAQKETANEIKESVNRIEDKLDRYVFGR